MKQACCYAFEAIIDGLRFDAKTPEDGDRAKMMCTFVKFMFKYCPVCGFKIKKEG